MSQTEISRESLYEMVWKEPVTAIARRLGVSDVAVIKTCKKLNVPRPPRGYWARRQHGYAVPDAPPLEPAGEYTPTTHTFTPHDRLLAPNRTDKPPPVVVVSPNSATHRELKEIRATLTGARPDRYGRVGLRERGVNVSPRLVPRAIRTLGALFAALEARGHSVRHIEEDLRITVSGEVIEIAAYEGANREKVGKPSEYGYQRWDYKSSGLLTLKVWVPRMYGMRRQWSDSKHSQIDSKLGEVVVALESMAPLVRRQREEDELRHRRWERARLEEQRAENRIEFTRKRAARIDELTENLTKAARIRELVSAIERSADAPSTSKRLARWASQYADHLDPVLPFRIAELCVDPD